MRIIALWKRWLLQIEHGVCMDSVDKKHPDIKQIGNEALDWFGFMGNCLDHRQKFDQNSRESKLGGKYLPTVPWIRVLRERVAFNSKTDMFQQF